MYGVFPQVIRDKKTGEFKWNPQANDFPPELTEEELQQFIPVCLPGVSRCSSLHNSTMRNSM